MFNLKGGILLCGVFIGLTDSKAGDTPNQKMKKLYRNGIEIMNIMANFAVEKELAEQTIANALNDADDESGKDNSGISRKVGDDRRLGDFMISTRIHQSWTKKFTNQFKYLQRKFNSVECNKYGNPINSDVVEVWGKIIDKEGLEDYFSQFRKLVWSGQQSAVRHMGATKPLTALYLEFSRIRLWIDESISQCHDPSKVTEGSKGSRGASRVVSWVNKGHKKFSTMERRVCHHLYKGLVRAKPEDNPYHDNPDCKSDQFRKKSRDNGNKEKKSEREAARAAKQNKNKNTN